MPQPSPLRQLPPFTVRIGATLAIPAVLRSLGKDPQAVLREAGLDITLFDSPENRISYAERAQLIAHCAASTGCPHFGLLVGQAGSLNGFGTVGLLARYSANVETALRGLVQYFHLHLTGATVELRVAEDRAVLYYRIYQPDVEASEHIGDGAVAMSFNILRSLCGADWKPSEILFAHRAPADFGPYRSFFGSRLVFDAEEYGVAFPASWLARPLPEADAQLRELLQRQVHDLHARYGDDLPAQVRGVLVAAVMSRQARAEQIAAVFCVHSRTLSRRLAAYGTSFQALVDECRYAVARQLLETSGLDVATIADSLDYADASAFTRAFRRWSGDTPASWRRKRIAAKG